MFSSATTTAHAALATFIERAEDEALPQRTAACLLALTASGECAELLVGGVAPRRVAALYPPDIAALYPTLNALLDAGARFEFPSSGTMYWIREEDRHLSMMPAASGMGRLALLGALNVEVAQRINAHTNAMVGAGQWATAAERIEHVRTGLDCLARAFFYATHCNFRDRERVGRHLLGTTRRTLPELLPSVY